MSDLVAERLDEQREAEIFRRFNRPTAKRWDDADIDCLLRILRRERSRIVRIACLAAADEEDRQRAEAAEAERDTATRALAVLDKIAWLAAEEDSWFGNENDIAVQRAAAELAEAALSASPSPTLPAHRSQNSMKQDQIKHMVDRFLNWKLPENFRPDAGISFKTAYNEGAAHPMKHEPFGTNLFDAVQAEEMVRYMIDGMPE